MIKTTFKELPVGSDFLQSHNFKETKNGLEGEPDKTLFRKLSDSEWWNAYNGQNTVHFDARETVFLPGLSEELTEREKDLINGLKRCLAYLEHPDVKALSFAVSSSVLAKQIRVHLASLGEEI